MFTLVHISDFHLCRPENAPLAAFAGKRLLSYASWRLRRRRHHDPRILAALARSVKDQAADQVAMTGDLTQLALPQESEAALRCLEAIGPPRQVFLIPGNHDALVPAGWEDRVARWADYLAADAPGPQRRPQWPTLRVRGRVALIGLCSAHPTPPLSATGRLGADQLNRCARLLQDAAQRYLYRILMVHHPPVPGMLSARRGLVDAPALADVVRRHGAELILHGHIHRRSRVRLPGAGSPVPVLGAPSATETSPDPLRRAGFGVVRISPAAAGWETTLQDHWYVRERNAFVPGAQESVINFPPHLVFKADKTYL
jgi:3',5'-cyclic AMP phosphodiesterase CpdA